MSQTLSAVLRTALRFDRDGWRPGMATLRTVGVAIPILGSVALGHPAWGSLAGLGALYSGVASFGGVLPARLRRMIANTLAMAAITLLGSMVSGSIVASVAAVAVASLVLSLLAASSPDAGTVAVQATGVLIVLSGIADSGENPLGNAGLVLAGGLIQTAVQSLMGPFNPRYPERRNVADAFRTLARFTEGLVAGEGGIPDATPFQEARARIDEALRFGFRDEHAELRHVLRVAEALRAALVGYASAARRLDPAASLAGHETHRRLADAFRQVENDVAHGRYGHAPAFEPVRLPPDLGRWVDLIQRDLNELARRDVPGESDPAGSWRSWLPSLPKSEAIRAAALRHALRYSVALSVVTLISRSLGLQHSYWMPLTVALVLRAEYAATLTRGVARILGTIVGVVVASLATETIHPTATGLAAFVIAATWLSFAVFRANYAVYALAITLFVVFSVTSLGVPERAAGIERLASTGVGVVVAVVMLLVWPSWQSARVREVLRDAFRRQLEYADDLRALIQGSPADSAEESRHRGRTLRIEAERVVEAARLEPKWGRIDGLAETEDLLRQLDENAAVLLAIHAEALDARAGGKPVTLETMAPAFAVAEAALRKLEPGSRSGTPRPS